MGQHHDCQAQGDAPDEFGLHFLSKKLISNQQAKPDEQNCPDDLLLWKVTRDKKINVQGYGEFKTCHDEVENS